MEISFLQILLYVLGAALLLSLIILVIKVIYSVNRINYLLDSVSMKMKTVDKAFVAVDKIVDTFSLASDRFVDSATSLITKIFKKKKVKKEREDD